ncbi:helix-turn-helix domain-containing protein [Calothrix sp. NIES-3974]|uniref:helix-turn-helix domain-containing protein n=1 Tax=Calothrix sp. NIES-3974 TaxID=2005462 RepID=UPI000B5E7C00|nr:helix-turn-helix domain-containing protein [Calothrix sp. NIES-3974]BAZ05655.1 hypothetical protein NIES3974_23070 [Calothrix sp. NIES-3974]
MLQNYLSTNFPNLLTIHPAIANLYLFAKLFGKASRKAVSAQKVDLFPGPVTVINWVLVLLFAVIVLLIAIVILKLIFTLLYTQGNQDKQLLPLMRQAGISNWQTFKQKTGVSDTTLWELRDGNISNLKISELQQISQTLSLPLGDFLQKFSFPIDNPEVIQLRQENQELQTKLQAMQVENHQLQQQIMALQNISEKPEQAEVVE